MNNPKTEELVAILKKCAESDSCLGCPHLMIEGGCIEHWMRTAAARLEEMEAVLVALKEEHHEPED